MFYDPDHSPLWNACSQAVWIIGTAYSAALGFAVLLSLPNINAAVRDDQQQVVLEHAAICDKLGMAVDTPGRADCLDMLLHLQQRHE